MIRTSGKLALSGVISSGRDVLIEGSLAELSKGAKMSSIGCVRIVASSFDLKEGSGVECHTLDTSRVVNMAVSGAVTCTLFIHNSTIVCRPSGHITFAACSDLQQILSSNEGLIEWTGHAGAEASKYENLVIGGMYTCASLYLLFVIIASLFLSHL